MTRIHSESKASLKLESSLSLSADMKWGEALSSCFSSSSASGEIVEQSGIPGCNLGQVAGGELGLCSISGGGNSSYFVTNEGGGRGGGRAGGREEGRERRFAGDPDPPGNSPLRALRLLCEGRELELYAVYR